MKTKDLGFGDILFFGSNDWIGKAIRWGQKTQTLDGKPSRWSHVAIYYTDGLIVESTLGFEKYKNESIFANGVQVYPFEERYKSSSDEFAVIRQTNEAIYPFIKLYRVVDLFRGNIRYPIWGLFGSLLTYYVFKGLRYNVFDSGKHRLYCSAFVASLIPSEYLFRLQQALPYPYNNYDVTNISPELLWQMLTSKVAVNNKIVVLANESK